jgi:hypothetical protein
VPYFDGVADADHLIAFRQQRPRSGPMYIRCLRRSTAHHSAIPTRQHEVIILAGARLIRRLAGAREMAPKILQLGSGAAAMRIEAVRRIFPKCWFNEATTEAGQSCRAPLKSGWLGSAWSPPPLGNDCAGPLL